MKQTLLLIDGHNLLFRSYGIPFKFYSKKGTPLHVVTTFLKLVRQAISYIHEYSGCDYVYIVFDSQQPNSNSQLLSDYKKNRKQDYSEEVESPFTHYPLILNALDKMNVAHSESIGVEADDYVASMASVFLKTNSQNQVVITSNDSDFYQLLSERVAILHLKRPTPVAFQAADLKERLRITPSQYVEYKSMIGDRTDNVEGIRGIGPVRAAQIVNGELEVDLTPFKKLLKLNRDLIRLNCDVPVETDIEKMRVDFEMIGLANRELFELCGF